MIVITSLIRTYRKKHKNMFTDASFLKISTLIPNFEYKLNLKFIYNSLTESIDDTVKHEDCYYKLLRIKTYETWYVHF